MNVIVNYPDKNDKDGWNKLNKGISEFQAALIIEAIKNLSLCEKEKKKIFEEILKTMEKNINWYSFLENININKFQDGDGKKITATHRIQVLKM